jgi:hypothetical protein
MFLEPIRPPAPPADASSRAAWMRRCAPVLAFLVTPRTHEQIRDWASRRAMSASRLEKMLAWLREDGQLTELGRETQWTRI